MSEHSNSTPDHHNLRELIIGLGEKSLRKNYFPQLQHQIEELSAAKASLEHREATLLTITQSARDAIIMMDGKGRISFWNPSAERILGWSEKEALGQELHKMLAPQEYHPSFLEAFSHFQKNGVGQAIGKTIELKAVTKNGQVIPVEISLASMEYEGTWQAVGVMRDCSERKKAEQALRDSEERYRQLVECSPDTIYIQCEEKIVYINPAGLKLFGAVHPDQILGRPVLEFVHPDFRSTVRERMKKLNQSGQVATLLEEKYLRLDGKALDVEVMATPFTFEGKPAAQVMVHDLTKRKIMEAQLLRSQRMETIGNLTGGIAHDLNNVLAPLLMALPLVREKHQDEETLFLLDSMEEGVRRGTNIVKQLLAFGRGKTTQIELVDLKLLVKETLRFIKETFPKTIDSNLACGPEDYCTKANVTQMQQVLLNLCVNSRDAMPDGGRIDFFLEKFQADETYTQNNPEAKPGTYVLLSVQDTGEGIPPEIRDRLFEPFQTTKEHGKGTGLGLFTVMNIVKNASGFIEVTSEPGKGACFRLFLPSTTQEPQSPVPTTRTLCPIGRGETILIMDDEAHILDVTRRVLNKNGYQVVTASDGAEGVALFSEKPDQIKAVLVDLMMPVLEGSNAISALRQINPHIPIVVISGNITRETESQLLNLKDITILSKPFSKEVLLTVLHNALHGVPSVSS